jgi:multidrug efflux pump subunit AcrB
MKVEPQAIGGRDAGLRFYDLALAIAGGLIVLTLLTLVVVSCLYPVLFGADTKPAPATD